MGSNFDIKFFVKKKKFRESENQLQPNSFKVTTDTKILLKKESAQNRLLIKNYFIVKRNSKIPKTAHKDRASAVKPYFFLKLKNRGQEDRESELESALIHLTLKYNEILQQYTDM